MTNWLVQEWAQGLAPIMESMSGERPEVECSSEDSPSSGELFWWQQTFNLMDGPAIWVGAPEAVRKELGSRILRAAGIEEPEPADLSDTYREILSQSFSALARALTSHCGKEVLSGNGQAIPAAPALQNVFSVRVKYADSPLLVLHAVLNPEFAGAVAPPVVDPPTSESAPTPAALSLLLDMELPVVISMGRVQMPLQDFINLNLGSTVELSRSVDEPVEILINNQAIARGEVVVLGGNYAVKVKQIVSRAERLHSSTSRLLSSDS